MGFELTIQSLSQIGWQGSPGQDRANPKSGEGRRRAFSPAGAKTPKDALALIKQLYQAGRIDELAALLRNSQTFRMAWQSLQQSSCIDSEAAEIASLIPAMTSPPDRSGLPVPHPGAGPQSQLQSQDLSVQQVTATPRSSPKIPAARNYPVPSSRPTRSLAAGRQVYENLASYYAQERADLRLINVRI